MNITAWCGVVVAILAMVSIGGKLMKGDALPFWEMNTIIWIINYLLAVAF